VKVIDVFPADSAGRSRSGRELASFQMLVRADVMRGRYRNGFVRPEPFARGLVTPVRFTLQDVFHRFGPRHRLMVQIQSSWFPLVDRNPQSFVNIYTARPEDFRSAEHAVFHGADHPSSLVLPLWDEHLRSEGTHDHP
jgi:predicted acyl esterase